MGGVGGRWLVILAGLWALVEGRDARNTGITSLNAQQPVTPQPYCSGGFSARKAAPPIEGEEVPRLLRFQEVLTNLGGWSVQDNVFQAPCTGAYFFTFHAISDDDKDFTVALMKEGVYQATAYGTKHGYQQGSNSALLFLNMGERVYLEVQQGSIYEHPFNEVYTTFTGFMVEHF
ncbi:complement C1q-like protein 4 [Procambarus clarkii]|uniref:complement C1q-like protein 4 n=1 Tax=Procambarus clarkii TaxID=6728 RepID=UPI0037435E14